MRPTALTSLLLVSMMLAACGSPGSDSGDSLTCGPGTKQEGDQCVGTGGGSRPDAAPSLSTDFSDVAYSFVRYTYVMSLSSDGDRVIIRTVFDDTTAPIMQIEGNVTGATTFTVDLAGVDTNNDLSFGDGEVFEATGDGTLDSGTNYDGQAVQVLTIDNLVIGGQEFGFIDGILDSTFALTPSE